MAARLAVLLLASAALALASGASASDAWPLAITLTERLDCGEGAEDHELPHGAAPGTYLLALRGVERAGGEVAAARALALGGGAQLLLADPLRALAALGRPLAYLWAEAELTLVDAKGAPLPQSGEGSARVFPADTAKRASAAAQAYLSSGGLGGGGGSGGGSASPLGGALAWLFSQALDPLQLFASGSAAVKGTFDAYIAPVLSLGRSSGEAHLLLNPYPAEQYVAVALRGGGALRARCRLNPLSIKRPAFLLIGLALGTYADYFATSPAFLTAGLVTAALALSVILCLYFVWQHQNKRSTLAASFLAASASYASWVYRETMRAYALAHLPQLPVLVTLLDHWEVVLFGGVVVVACVLLYVVVGSAANNALSLPLLVKLIQGLGALALYHSCAWHPAGVALVAAVLWARHGLSAVVWATVAVGNAVNAALRAVLWLAALPELLLEAALHVAVGYCCCGWRRPYAGLTLARSLARALGYEVTLGDVRAVEGGGGGGGVGGSPRGDGAGSSGAASPGFGAGSSSSSSSSSSSGMAGGSYGIHAPPPPLPLPDYFATFPPDLYLAQQPHAPPHDSKAAAQWGGGGGGSGGGGGGTFRRRAGSIGAAAAVGVPAATAPPAAGVRLSPEAGGAAASGGYGGHHHHPHRPSAPPAQVGYGGAHHQHASHAHGAGGGGGGGAVRRRASSVGKSAKLMEAYRKLREAMEEEELEEEEE